MDTAGRLAPRSSLAAVVVVHAGEEQAALGAAHHIERRLRRALDTAPTATLAVSGGSTPAPMLRALAGADLPWESIHLFQVDERIAPAGHADRNATQLATCLLDAAPLRATNVHLMDVEGPDPIRSAERYAELLARWAPAGLDIVHLGLGDDGHTASLVSGDQVLEITDRAVAVTGVYRGRRRLSLTYPELARARAVVWLAPGAAKAAMLRRLLAHDHTIPAGRVAAGTVFTDIAGLGVAS